MQIWDKYLIISKSANGPDLYFGGSRLDSRQRHSTVIGSLWLYPVTWAKFQDGILK
jgi:hypothetical protein